jgi:hypothetical protein
VFSRYRNYEGEKERPLTDQERKHLDGLMDEATIVVDKYQEDDPEQARWYARTCEAFEGTQVSVVATPWDQALANRVPLDLGAVSEATLDAKLAMAEVVLRGVDRANRRRLGLPADVTGADAHSQPAMAEPPRWFSQPAPPGPAAAPQPAAGDAPPPLADGESEPDQAAWPARGMEG